MSDQVRQLGEVLVAAAPHIEQMDTLQERKAALEKRNAELAADLAALVAQTNAVRQEAQQAAKFAMDAADQHWKDVTEGLEKQKADAAKKVADFEELSKKQVAEFDANLAKLKQTIGELTKQKDALTVAIGKQKAALADSIAAL